MEAHRYLYLGEAQVGIHPIIGPGKLDTNFRNDISRLNARRSISDVDACSTIVTVHATTFSILRVSTLPSFMHYTTMLSEI